MRTARVNYRVAILLNVILFQAGLVSNATGALIPDAVRDFGLSYSGAALLPLMYFVAYAVVSVPAGILSEKIHPRAVLAGSFVLGAVSLLMFAAFPLYGVALIAFFGIGCWLAACQVVLFPLMRTAFGAENLALATTITTLMYGLGSIAGPCLYSALAPVSGAHAWAPVYWVFFAIALTTLGALAPMRFPEPEKRQDERNAGARVYLSLFRSGTVLFYAVAVLCYVACEQGCANWLSEFLHVRHGLDPRTEGARILSLYWLLLTAGCLAGALLVRLIDSRRILFVSTLLAATALSGAIFGDRKLSVASFPMVGLFLSVLWPLLVALALNSLETHHGAMMGILMSCVSGGAAGPWFVGRLADAAGLQVGLTILCLPLAFIAHVSLRARPLTSNSTVFHGQTAWKEPA